jgi:hypothetical protein
MKAAEIFGFEEVAFAEPSFAALTDRHYNAVLAAAGGDEGRFLIDENEEPLAFAFHVNGGWNAATFLYRPPSTELIDLFGEMNGEILQEDRQVWAAAVREYFSRKLAADVPPSIEDLNPGRRQILIDLIGKVWGRGSGQCCLDCCCGSGVGSQVLRELAYRPLSYDNDASLLSRGLLTGRLLPEESMCIDATVASRYIEPVSLGIGIMMGEINSFSQDMWQQICRELFVVSEKTLITVGTEKETEIISTWGADAGRKLDVMENPADPIYDCWVCVG